MAHRLKLVGRKLHQPGHCCCQRKRVACFGEKAGLPLREDFAAAGNIGGNGGQGTGCSLQQAHRQAFPQGREDKSIGSLQPGPHILLEAQKMDAAFQAELIRPLT
jgi:hypothetical protein